MMYKSITLNKIFSGLNYPGDRIILLKVAQQGYARSRSARQ